MVKLKEQHKEVIDIFIFRRNEGPMGDYCMYVVTTTEVVLYKGVDKMNKQDDMVPVTDDKNLLMEHNCQDCDSRGHLLIDSARSFNESKEHYVTRYDMRKNV